MCVEPIKSVFDRLLSNRPNCINLNCAIDEKDGTADFIYNKGYTEMISGLKDHYDPRHHIRMKNEIHNFGGESNVITVNTKKLSSVFDENNINHVHYLSIDVEGAEFNVIKSIDFNKVFIDVIDFENNYPDKSLEIIHYLIDKHYVLVPFKCLDIMMIHIDSAFFTDKYI